MKNTIRLMLMIFLLIYLHFNALSQESSIDYRFVNPCGWKLPDVAFMEHMSTEIKTYSSIPQKIIVENYEYTGKNWPQDKIHYYILDKQILPGGEINFKAEERLWVKRLKIYRRGDNNQILCYLFDCVVDGIAWDVVKGYQKKGVIDGVGGGWTSNIIFDLDGDGILESLLDAYQYRTKPEEVIVIVLRIKLGIKSNTSL